MKIFLGGTCPSDKNDFDYRVLLIPLLEENKIEYFNPVVENWTPECQEIEEQQKQVCDVHLYVIAPNMKGVYSIAECFGSIIKNNKRSILVYLDRIQEKTFDSSQLKSLEATGKLLSECGGEAFELTNESELYMLLDIL